MKNLFFILSITIIALSCKNEPTKVADTAKTDALAIKYESFGEQISDVGVMTEKEMVAKYENLKPGDTLAVKFSSVVKEVCQKKGCWMYLDMGEKQAMVRFKDYGFFMPKDISGREVIIEGNAYVEEMSVEDQRHYAEDAGKDETEIALIISPKRTLAFEAKGVLIPEIKKQ